MIAAEPAAFVFVTDDDLDTATWLVQDVLPGRTRSAMIVVI